MACSAASTSPRMATSAATSPTIVQATGSSHEILVSTDILNLVPGAGAPSTRLLSGRFRGDTDEIDLRTGSRTLRHRGHRTVGTRRYRHSRHRRGRDSQRDLLPAVAVPHRGLVLSQDRARR